MISKYRWLIAGLLAIAWILPTHAQISGAGQLSCSGATITGTAATSGTANNTVLASLASSPAYAALVQLDQTTTITGGAITFNLSYDGGVNYTAVPVAQVLNPSTGAQLTNPYTLAASTNQSFLIVLAGASNFQVKLTTAVIGSATVTPYVTGLCSPPTLGPLTLDASGNVFVNIKAQTLGKLLVTPDSVALPLHQSTNVDQFGGNAVATGTGTSGNGIPRVTLSNDSSLAANQSVNVNQFGGSAVVTGTGAAGAGIPRVTLSNDSSLAANQSVNLSQIGGTTVVADPCASNAKVYFSNQFTANTQIITGTSAKKVFFCSLNIVVGAATGVAVVEGTGTVCATGIATFPGLSGGTTAATGWNFGANGGLTYGNGGAALAGEATNADNVCVLISAANQTNVSGSYVVQ